jgi:hypothetical protein
MPRFAGKCFAAAAATIAALAALGGPAEAQTVRPLTNDERARALDIEATANRNRPGAGGTTVFSSGRQGPNKSVVTQVVPLEPVQPRRNAQTPFSTGQPRRLSEITRFDYATGATIRTTVDINTGAVVDTQSEMNYPTPLAAEELAEAKRLLLANAADVAEIARIAGPRGPSYLHLVPVASDKGAPRYGHRLVLIWVNKPRSSKQYVVDLTTSEVIVDEP